MRTQLVVRCLAVAVGAVGLAALVAPAAASAETTAPSPPGNLHVTDLHETSFTVSWDPVTKDNDPITYTAYTLPTGALNETAATQATWTGMMPNTSYTVHVRSFDSWTVSYSEETVITVTTPRDTTAPSAPAHLQLADTSAGKATLAWTASTDNDQINTYRVSSAGAPAFSWLTTSGGDPAVVIPQMAPGTVRTFTVQAVDRSGNVSPGATVTVTMPANADTTPPSAPPNFIWTGDFGARFSWSSSVDNVTPAQGIDYVLNIDGKASQYLAGGRTVVEFFDYGYCVVTLPAGTHTYTVQAVDGAGNTSAASTSLVVSN